MTELAGSGFTDWLSIETSATLGLPLVLAAVLNELKLV